MFFGIALPFYINTRIAGGPVSQCIPLILMVFAVQCPNPQCRKYQLVEERDRGGVVHCLICKTAIRVAGAPVPPSAPQKPAPAKPAGA
jgi:hypothetical protein